jgi:ribonuclease-3
MSIGKALSGLEERLGYKFKDCALLENALTHASYSNECEARGIRLPSNERLEFLGDAVLQIVISHYLYLENKLLAEGDLTRIRRHLVCTKTLYEIALSLSLGEYLHLGNSEEANGCRSRPKVLADAMEAVIGAMYLDDPESARKILLALLVPHIPDSFGTVEDAKTRLQQLVEQDGASDLVYEVEKEVGPDHDKRFTVVAKVNNNAVGRGTAGSKKDAEMQAAAAALALFGIKE